MIDNLDRHKAGMIAAAALEQRPELAKVLGRSVGTETGWRIRCDLIDGDRVVISARSVSSGATIALAEVPRAAVTLDAELVQ
jgi:hypothetical protein